MGILRSQKSMPFPDTLLKSGKVSIETSLSCLHEFKHVKDARHTLFYTHILPSVSDDDIL